MPIVNCFTSRKEFSDQLLSDLVRQWSEKIKVAEKDITINFFTSHAQAGQKYKFLMFLYLPSLWNEESIKRLQTTLLELFIESFKVSANEVFILTNKIESGNVMENGKVVNWK